MEQIEWDDLGALTPEDEDAVPPPPWLPTGLSGGLAQRWAAIAGIGISLAWLIVMTATMWSAWQQAGIDGINPDGLGDPSFGKHLSDALIYIGRVSGVSGAIGIVALAAYFFTASVPNRASRSIALGYLTLGGITWIATVWSLVRSFADDSADGFLRLSDGPSRLASVGTLIGSAVMVMLALAILGGRPFHNVPE